MNEMVALLNTPELPRNTVICGDCLDVLREMADCSVDAIVTDPPYGLGEIKNIAGLLMAWIEDEDDSAYKGKSGFMNAQWDAGVPGPRYWREVYRVMKPGAHLLAFSGTRTYDLLVIALRLSGFECRDQIDWIYGSGFPKSTAIDKQIDKLAPRQGMFHRFAQHFKEQRIISGLSQKQIAQYFPSKTGGMTGCVWNWENGANVPTLEQWETLQPLLNLSDAWLPLIERVEAEREVIGKDKNWGKSGSVPLTRYGEFDITAPATPEAARYSGYGTALKPSHEPICLARKPLSEPTIAQNVLRWGCGGLNIDACRIGTQDNLGRMNNPGDNGWKNSSGGPNRATYDPVAASGRWPSNTLFSHTIFCRQTGVKRVRGTAPRGKPTNGSPKADGHPFSFGVHNNIDYADPDGMETIDAWECSDDCPVRILGEQSGVRKTHAMGPKYEQSYQEGAANPRGQSTVYGAYNKHHGQPHGSSEGTAARYFAQFSPSPDELEVPFIYAPKASRAERNRGCEGLPEGKSSRYGRMQGTLEHTPKYDTPEGNSHPTVKSLSLMKYLCRLVGVPGGVILDPFMGSGSTCVAALQEGFGFIGIEQDASYVEIARARIQHAMQEAGIVEVQGDGEWICSDDCPVHQLTLQSKGTRAERSSGGHKRHNTGNGHGFIVNGNACESNGYDDSAGGASRFFAQFAPDSLWSLLEDEEACTDAAE